MKKLYLSKKNKKFLGVCGGLAEYFDVDPVAMRVAWVVISIFTGGVPGLIAYLLAALIMPPAPES